MNRRSLFVLFAAVFITFGITRYTTIHGVIGDSERIIESYQKTIAMEAKQQIEAEKVQYYMSRIKQAIYFSQGLFQWRMGLIISGILSLTFLGLAIKAGEKAM